MSHRSSISPEGTSAAAGEGAEPAAMDEAAALQRVGGDEAFLRELVALFLGECPRLLSGIEGAIAGADWQALERAAHELRGAAATLSAAALADAARQLERIGREADPRPLGAARARFDREFARLQPLLVALVEERGP